MFGGHDDGAEAPQNDANGDDTLNGVTDLVGGTATPGPGDVGYVPAPPSDPVQSTDNPEPSEELEEAVAPTPAPEDQTEPTTSASSPDANEELLEIKQQALQQLTPLVGQLEQSPEEEFRTTMMLIQASDNQELLKKAYQAAQAITDEKIKAQALLDVINEINYFTQQTTK